jgi:LysR family transcriptional regulator for metE and metH
MLLELRHLRLVQAIAEEGSVTRAGRRLHLTQSALSHQLRDVEERLGARLFDRIGKRMVLAPAGERLLACAPGVLGEVERAEQEIRLGAREGHGVLRLTTQCTTVYHWLPSRLRLFQKRDPDVEVQVVAGATNDPLAALLEGRIDLAIAYRGRGDARLQFVPLFKDEIVMVLHPEHPLTRKPFVAAADLVSEHLIVYLAPREANFVFRELLIPAGVTPHRVTHVQLTEATVELVKAGLGVATLPRWAVAPQIERGELVARPLTSGGRFRHWSAAYRRRPAPPEYLLRFVELLAKHPLPLGRTARERRQLPALVADLT